MYCGSCLRDNALAGALKRLGHQVTLVPLFSPVRTDVADQSNNGEVFFGGVNIYLQHASPLFRHTPRALDWLLDRKWLLNVATKYGSGTPPEQLVGLLERTQCPMLLGNRRPDEHRTARCLY